MYQLIIVVHVLLGLGIIGLIMIQQGKGADAGATFGGGGASGSVFGAQGSASFLSRTTAIFATLFFITSLSLAIFNSHQSAKSTDIMDVPELEQKAADVPMVGNNAPSSNAVPSVPTATPSVTAPSSPQPTAQDLPPTNPATVNTAPAPAVAPPAPAAPNTSEKKP